MTDQKKEEKKPEEQATTSPEERVKLETERDYKALRTVIRGLAMSRIWSRDQEEKAMNKLYRLYLKAKGEYDPKRNS